jgi:RNA polymerase subunit RPABC4/transcription elongation factor Spt4
MHLYRLFLIGLVITSLSACKQEQSPKPQNQKYVQYFNGSINGKDVDIKTQKNSTSPICDNCNVESIAGDWTGYPSVNKEAYTVSVRLSKERSGDEKMPLLEFRIFDIKIKSFNITGEENIFDALSTYVVIVKKEKSKTDNTYYSPDPQKKPFEITINKYEFKPDSGLPFVGGKLNGVLYNTANRQDSIVIKDCNFEVRY